MTPHAPPSPYTYRATEETSPSRATLVTPYTEFCGQPRSGG
nr:hypothetical protein [Actinomadura darangshiensis]